MENRTGKLELQVASQVEAGCRKVWGNLRVGRPSEVPVCKQCMDHFFLQPFRQALFGLLIFPLALDAPDEQCEIVLPVPPEVFFPGALRSNGR
jgi:hypothetical protein